MSELRSDFDRPWGGNSGAVGDRPDRGLLVGSSDRGPSRGQIEWPAAEPALGRVDAATSDVRSRRSDEPTFGAVEPHAAGVDLIGVDEFARGDDQSEIPARADDAPAAGDEPPTVPSGESTESADVPADHASTPDERPSRATNPLVTELMKAMHGAAESARNASLAGVNEDAKARIEAIHATSSEEATAIRAAADAEINEIRAWSKAELARIREETDARIAGRRERLASEIDDHAASVERRIEQVQTAVTEFQGRMADFFTMLLAETDPARVATLAERLPAPPAMDRIGEDAHPAAPAGPARDDTPEAAPAQSDAAATSVAALAAPDEVALGEPERLTPEGAMAAESEAADAAGDAAPDDVVPGPEASGDQVGELTAEDAVAARLARLVAGAPVGPSAQTQVVVRGLATVGSIAGFKRAIARLEGVASVNVSSGPGGEFIFLTSHAPTADLATAISGFAGYDAQVSLEADGSLAVTAHDRETVG